MMYESLLVIYIEVSIAIVGFSGLIAALKSGSQRPWTINDHVSFRFLLAGGGGTAFFSALPLILVGAGLNTEIAWEISSYLVVLTMGARWVAIFLELRNNLERQTVLGVLASFLVILVVGIGGFLGYSWTYMVFLTVFIGMGLTIFSLLVMRLVREKEVDV